MYDKEAEEGHVHVCRLFGSLRPNTADSAARCHVGPPIVKSLKSLSAYRCLTFVEFMSTRVEESEASAIISCGLKFAE